MRVISDRNVNGLFVQGLEMLGTRGVRQSSRNGDVYVMPCPVTSVYREPCERVLFDPVRDANPFFHLFECLWMLSGSNDARMLDRYVSDFSSRYADDGVIHGAYGHRWRTALGFDQLDAVVRRLRASPDDRQCVIQMWDASSTLEDAHQSYPGGNDLLGDWRDRPCNTHVYLRVRNDPVTRGGGLCIDQKLDLTVCCRSNDVVWGAYGANAVHFSFLQEYLAGRIGVGVGTMYQVSNNWHGYVDVLDKIGDPMDLSGTDPYDEATVWAMPIGTDFDKWDEDLSRFMAWHERLWTDGPGDAAMIQTWNGWFHDVAAPMCLANLYWKQRMPQNALSVMDLVGARDWRMAGQEWIRRRVDKRAEAVG